MQADLENASTLGSVALLIARGLQNAGHEPIPLFAAAGIDIDTIHNPDIRFPVVKLQKLWRLSVEATHNPCFGLLAAQQLQPATLHGLGFAWLASNTLRDALSRLVRYSRMVNSIARIRLEDHGDTTDLVVSGTENWPNFEHAAIDAGMAIFLRMSRIAVGNELSPVQVLLQRPEPACSDQFYRLFAAPVTFGASKNRLCFRTHEVDAPLPCANAQLARVNDQTVMDYLSRFDRTSISMQVRIRIIEQLPDGTPTQESIASVLNVSRRSLQRKLHDETTNFKHLLKNTRRELALQYIDEPHRSISEITYLLGFSEPSNFSRAFKRWTGQTPVEYRRVAD